MSKRKVAESTLQKAESGAVDLPRPMRVDKRESTKIKELGQLGGHKCGSNKIAMREGEGNGVRGGKQNEGEGN